MSSVTIVPRPAARSGNGSKHSPPRFRPVEKYSKVVGLWQTEAGQPNEVCHIWAYPSLNARAEARANALKDPAWQEFLGKGPPLLEEMHSAIMLPAPHSPLK